MTTTTTEEKAARLVPAPSDRPDDDHDQEEAGRGQGVEEKEEEEEDDTTGSLLLSLATRASGGALFSTPLTLPGNSSRSRRDDDDRRLSVPSASRSHRQGVIPLPAAWSSYYFQPTPAALAASSAAIPATPQPPDLFSCSLSSKKKKKSSAKISHYDPPLEQDHRLPPPPPPQQQQQQQQQRPEEEALVKLAYPPAAAPSPALPETSFLSSTTSSSSSPSISPNNEVDVLNQSTWSDTTELTASVFIREAAARQKWPFPPPPLAVLQANPETAAAVPSQQEEDSASASPPLEGRLSETPQIGEAWLSPPPALQPERSNRLSLNTTSSSTHHPDRETTALDSSQKSTPSQEEHGQHLSKPSPSPRPQSTAPTLIRRMSLPAVPNRTRFPLISSRHDASSFQQQQEASPARPRRASWQTALGTTDRPTSAQKLSHMAARLQALQQQRRERLSLQVAPSVHAPPEKGPAHPVMMETSPPTLHTSLETAQSNPEEGDSLDNSLDVSPGVVKDLFEGLLPPAPSTNVSTRTSRSSILSTSNATSADDPDEMNATYSGSGGLLAELESSLPSRKQPSFLLNQESTALELEAPVLDSRKETTPLSQLEQSPSNATVSPASTLSSAWSVSVPPAQDRGSLPPGATASLPDAIAFVLAQDGKENSAGIDAHHSVLNFSAEATSPFRLQPNHHKPLTPTRLAGPPLRLTNPEILLADSPARHTRSKQRRLENQRSSLEELPFVSTKRPRESTTPTHGPRLSDADESRRLSLASQPMLHSSLRKGGAAGRPSAEGRKSVAFGSPEVAEFNVTSPSTSFTPLTRQRGPSKKNKTQHFSLADMDTMELQADMQALWQRAPPSFDDLTQELEGNLAELVHKTQVPTSNDDDGEEEEEEMTLELEANLVELVNKAAEDPPRAAALAAVPTVPLATLPSSVDEEPTVDLEVNLASLVQKVYAVGQSSPPFVVPNSHSENPEDPHRSSMQDQSTMSLVDEVTELENHGDQHDEAESVQELVEALHEEEPTVELEVDMKALLHDADEGLAYPRGRRMSSWSSHRLSLAPSSRYSLSEEMEQQEEEFLLTQSDTGSNATDDPPSVPLVELNLTVGEILEAAGLVEEEEITVPGSDIIHQLDENVHDAKVQRILQGLKGTIRQEMVQSAAETLDRDRLLQPATEEIKDTLLIWQEMLRSGDESTRVGGLQDVKALAATMKDQILHGWYGWKVSAIDVALRQLLTKRQEDAEKEKRLQQYNQLLGQAQNSLYEMDRQLARRVNVKKLNHEKAAIQAELDELDRLILKEREAAALRQAKKQKNALTRCTEETRAEAESLERKSVILQGLHKWKAVYLDERTFVFQYLGNYPTSCAQLSFVVSETGSVTFKGVLDANLFRSHNSWSVKIPKDVERFFERSISGYFDATASAGISCPKDVAKALGQIDLNLSRVERTAAELLVVQRRYGASMSGTIFQLQVKVVFTDQRNAEVLSAVFDMNEAYPFSAITGTYAASKPEINVEQLQRILVRSTKPGIGQLTRTCDLISAFLNGITRV